ncbi:hypothetical protein E2I00_015768 [Balaenoptera physalus]|uniref:DH domain-containing protein n=1 Tax=Balaenoptera physalus TaxID=9770 RepID=A0A643CH08_BALPH|nr:hypothetical protein E2I00_015768 [Balaenoptera physalus]
MSQQHSDSSLEEKLLEYRFHSELKLDTEGNPASGLPMVRGSLQSRSNAAFQPDSPVPPSPSPEAQELRTIVLSTQSPAALKMGTQQLIPRSLAVSSKAKTPARHQSFGAAMLSKEAARRDPRLLSAPTFSLDDMDVDTGPGGMLRRNLRNQSYRAAMKGLGTPGGEGGPKTLGRKRAHKGSFKDDPRFYQEIQERGLNTSHESDDDLLDEASSPEGTQKVDVHVVVKSYRPPQITWSQLPEYSYQHSLGILVAEFLQFFEDLEQRHKAQVCVEDISDILEEHAERHFHPYVSYCSNEVYQQRALQRLTSSSAAFREALREIEQRPACGGLPMISFLILPMQRVTRLPLLTDTLCLKTQGHPERYKAASRALKAISKLVKQCNEGAHKMERTEQMYTLHTQLDFSKVKPADMLPVPVQRRPRGHQEEEDSFVVQDYAQLDHIQVQKMEPSEAALPGGGNRSSFVPYAFQLTLLHNSEGRQGKMLLSSDSAPAPGGDHQGLPGQAGWFYGERLRDGETGWFPEDLARSITSRVAVEGNMRRMERLRVETDV